MQATLCSQEREVKIGEEERMRTRLRRESWCSRKTDKVRVKYGANDATSFWERMLVTYSMFVLRRICSSDKNAGQW